MALRRAALLVAAMLAATPPAAHAAGRLDRAAAALRTADVFVHPDLGWLVDRSQQQQIAAIAAQSAVPLEIAVLPQLREDESGGDSSRILAGLWTRLRRPALYVTVDQNGFFDLASPGVRQHIRVPLSLVVPGLSTHPQATIVDRLEQLAQIVRDAPPGAAGGPPRVRDALEPVYPKERGTGWAEAIVTGAVLGLSAAFALRWVGRRLVRRRRMQGG